jgi:hypothetical protein
LVALNLSVDKKLLRTIVEESASTFGRENFKKLLGLLFAISCCCKGKKCSHFSLCSFLSKKTENHAHNHKV